MQIIVLILIVLLLIGAGAIIWLLKKQQPVANTGENLLQSIQTTNQQMMQTILQQLNAQQQSQENQSGQLHHRFTEASQTLSTLQAKMAQIEEGNKRILDMSQGITELQNILQAPKLRGNRGEIWLEELLAQMLPKGKFSTQFRFKTGDICDAVVHMRDGLILPIDSKFSLENFRKMVESKDPTEVKQFEKLFAADVKRRIDEISKKYVLPSENTLSYAFMYVPAENVYYQAFIEDKTGNELQRYAFDHHVIPVSPNSLYPYLEIVLFGLRGLEIEQSARQIQQGLINIVSDLQHFDEDYRKVGNNLRLAQQNFDNSDKKLAAAQTKILGLSSSTQEIPGLPEEIVQL